MDRSQSTDSLLLLEPFIHVEDDYHSDHDKVPLQEEEEDTLAEKRNKDRVFKNLLVSPNPKRSSIKASQSSSEVIPYTTCCCCCEEEDEEDPRINSIGKHDDVTITTRGAAVVTSTTTTTTTTWGKNHRSSSSNTPSSLNHAILILLFFGAIERCCYYGINYTQTSFLEGVYNEVWSANMDTKNSLEFASLTATLIFTYPIIGAIVSDSILGNYWTILISSVCLYLPGFLLLALVAQPYLLGQTFPKNAMSIAYLLLYAVGAGAIKPCLNILGAQQFHDSIYMKREIENFFIYIYVSNNIGAVLGGMVIPTIVEMVNPFVGYMVATCIFSLGAFVFIFAGNCFHKVPPQGKDNIKVFVIASRAICSFQGLQKQKESEGGRYPDKLVHSIGQLAAIVPVTMLTLPFNIVYGQIRTLFVAQGNVMTPCAFVDSSWIQNFESLAVVLAGIFINGWLYPNYELQNNGKGMKLSTKFAIGNAFGALSMLSAIFVDIKIVQEFNKSGHAISIFWQIPSFVFVGIGEIFAISSSYEAAFLIGPKNLKALTSALNLFFVGGLAPCILNRLFWAYSVWFIDQDGNTDLRTLPSYAHAHTVNFYALILGTTVIFVIINLMPAVDRFLIYTLSNNNANENCLLQSGAAITTTTSSISSSSSSSSDISTPATEGNENQSNCHVNFNKREDFDLYEGVLT